MEDEEIFLLEQIALVEDILMRLRKRLEWVQRQKNETRSSDKQVVHFFFWTKQIAASFVTVP
jgi:hypothetical protein